MKIVTLVGARPQFIKSAAVSGVLRAKAEEVLVHAGQHYDREMSQVFFEGLQLPEPDHRLEVGSGSHAFQTGETLKRFEAVLEAEQPDSVLVYGDTNTTLAGALAAAKLNIPIAHVEAGLRSFDRRMPEEVNRVVTDHLSTWLFCPAAFAAQNLATEGIHEGVFVVGDVMRATFERSLPDAKQDGSSRLAGKLAVRPYALATCHRAENTDDPERLAKIVAGLDLIASQHLPILLPLHPRTRAALKRDGIRFGSVQTLDPLPHQDMMALLAGARIVITDSGGLQKEAMWAGVPCLILRDRTEWLDTIESGWAGLVDADPAAGFKDGIPSAPSDHQGRSRDLQAAAQIVEILLDKGDRAAPGQAKRNTS